MHVFNPQQCRAIRVVTWIVLIAFMTGCAGMKTLSAADQATISSKVSVGDNVEITRPDGSVTTFEVERIDDAGVHGEGQSVPYADIREIRVGDRSENRTIVIALIFIGAVILGAAAGSGSGLSY